MLKKLYLAVFTFAFLTMTMAVPSQASEILILNLDKLFQNSAAGKHRLTKVQKRTDELKAIAEKAQAELRAEADKITEQRSLLTQDALRSKADELRLKEISKNQELEQERRKLETAAIATQNEIVAKLNPILKEILTERKAKVIVNRPVVLIGSADIDITDIVIKRLDAVIKKVKFEIPKN